MKFEQLVVGIGLLSVMGLPMFAVAADVKSITLKQIGRYSAGGTTTSAEISVYDPGTKRLFSINLALQRLDILDLSNPESQVLATVGTVALGGNPNSVAVHDGIVAVAIEGAQKTDPGTVKFFNTSGALLNSLTVGALPDMLVFSPNGTWLLVANEGEPSSYNNPVLSVDPEGSVSIIEMRQDVTSLTQLDVRTATFSLVIPQENASSIRIYAPTPRLHRTLSRNTSPCPTIPRRRGSHYKKTTRSASWIFQPLPSPKSSDSASKTTPSPATNWMPATGTHPDRATSASSTSATGRCSECTSPTRLLPIV